MDIEYMKEQMREVGWTEDEINEAIKRILIQHPDGIYHICKGDPLPNLFFQKDLNNGND